MSYNGKVYRKQGGDELVVMSGGAITAAGTQASALTTQLTSITIANAAGTPDYALQAVINSNAWGFASEQEAVSFLYVVQNLQARLAQVEAALEGVGIVAAN
jgi:hypothetical protein